METIMIKNILVPIAFSKFSEGIIRFASTLGAPHGAKLQLANVVNQRDLEAVERIASHGFKVDADRYIATIQQERLTKLEELVSKVGIDENDYDYIFLAGDPATELLKLCVKEEVDLIVMGTRAKDIRHLFTGSVAEKIFRRSPVPVVFHRGRDLARELTKKIKKEIAR